MKTKTNKSHTIQWSIKLVTYLQCTLRPTKIPIISRLVSAECRVSTFFSHLTCVTPFWLRIGSVECIIINQMHTAEISFKEEIQRWRENETRKKIVRPLMCVCSCAIRTEWPSIQIFISLYESQKRHAANVHRDYFRIIVAAVYNTPKNKQCWVWCRAIEITDGL